MVFMDFQMTMLKVRDPRNIPLFVEKDKGWRKRCGGVTKGVCEFERSREFLGFQAQGLVYFHV